MNPLTAPEVSALLQANGPGSTVYLVGAGGCGMSGLGHLLLDLGYNIAGADLVENETLRGLQRRGAEIHADHSGARLEAARPFLVVFSSAIQPANPELSAARRLQIPTARRGAVLAALLKRQRGICVTGMHGKTTTAALAAFALDQLQAKPSYAIGAEVPQLTPHARYLDAAPSPTAQSRVPSSSASSPCEARAGRGLRRGETQKDGPPLPGPLLHPMEEREESRSLMQPCADSEPFFVAEADESDGTLGEFQPEHAIILNADREHLDYFSDIESVCREFERFASRITGRVIYCADDRRLASLFASAPNAVSYGFHERAEYRIELESEPDSRIADDASRLTTFKIRHKSEPLGDFTLTLFGEQNISNAAAVIALLHQLQFQPLDIARAIRSFRGAARRQQELYRDDRVRVFDDYGHHPTEIRATLKALKQLAPQRLLVAFQPHRFSRTHHLMEEFARCFDQADRLWLAEIYSASEHPIAGVNSAALAEAIREEGVQVELENGTADLGAKIREAVETGDLIVFLGAGDITQAAHGFAEALRLESAQRRESLAADLSRILSAASIVRRDEPLAKRTTLRVGGRADLYVEPATEEDLALAFHFCAEHDLPFLILGRGSNLLIPDAGIRGVVISLAHSGFCRIAVQDGALHCGAGAKLKAVAVEARRHGIGGLEFLEGIPGSVGGALRMNAGAMGGATFERVESVRFMDFAGRVHERTAAEIEVQYRSCPLFRNHIALSAVLRGRPESPETIGAKMNACSQKRWKSQPAAPSAGCIFKNHPTMPAGRLIEELGLKGTRVGGAVISDVHGNFIVNERCATAEDVLALIEIVKERARSERGIDLETEVEIVGEIPPCRAWSEQIPSIDPDCPVAAGV